MKIKRLASKDKPVFDSFFRKDIHNLSCFSFVNVLIWKDFFNFFWTIIEDNLCLFAKNNVGCFMYLPPLGANISKRLVENCFKIMDGYNLDWNISRIENIEQDNLEVYNKLSLVLKPKDGEYIYETKNLISLSGNDFKAKRSGYNYFVKNYNFQYAEFQPKFKTACIKLYKNWSKMRKVKFKDTIYQAMLEDNFKVHCRVFDFNKELGLIGRIVKIDDEVKAYSFGFKLNKDTFCILLEVADLCFKGLPQFIFRQFSKELGSFKFINVMDDSGLKNIKRVKLSYRPCKLIPAYIATRSNA
ncbi:MAG: phosphatidylglycerol lysyltransferase domain-containing protein [Candidatus Omnitrophota bacterium]|nr:phosphatidylglycerol lysyltransferase domain-containing protein [Candidatus Omnitrophota bacterium]